jgi:type II secretory pathway component GspD/PulD (secretin)
MSRKAVHAASWMVWLIGLAFACGTSFAQDTAESTQPAPDAVAGTEQLLAQAGPDAAAPAPAPEPVVEAAAEPAPEPVAEPAPAPMPETAGDAGGASTTGVVELTTVPEAPGIEVKTAEESGKISISLDNVPLQDVIRMFTRISGANIVAGTNLMGTVTVNLQNVEWEPALKVILDVVGMALVERSPGIYTVLSKNELSGEPLVSDTLFLKFSTVSNVVAVVQKMLISTNATVMGFAQANAVVVQETRANLNTIKEIVEKIDRERPQVLIETKFVELNEEAIKDLGVNWEVMQGYTVGAAGLNREYSETRTFMEQNAEVGSAQTQSSDLSISGSESVDGETVKTSERTVTDSDSKGKTRVIGRNFEEIDEKGKITLVPPVVQTTVQSAILSAEAFSLTLSALKQNNGVSVVSNPKVIVSNGETANIHVGVNEPNIVAVPQGDTGDRYAYQLDSTKPFIEIGVKLEVTPVVNTESNINVRITPELSRLLGYTSAGDAGQQFPRTQIRKIYTEFNIESGRTIAIGGLTQSDHGNNVKKIPILGDIPVLGKYLFRHEHDSNKQDEVIIFVSVGVVNAHQLVTISGIPEDGRLIHEHLARREAEERAKLEKISVSERKVPKKDSAFPK